MRTARAVLAVLVGIHLVLPFTPVEAHPEVRIFMGSLLIGAAFACLLIYSWKRPQRAFLIGFVLTMLVFILGAVTGVSPLRDGLAVKFVLAAGLLLGVYRSRHAPGADAAPVAEGP